jgi:Fic family protein
LRGLADKLFEEPTISVREARDFSGVTYPTARADLRKLESLGIVSLLPGADEITYRLSVSALL